MKGRGFLGGIHVDACKSLTSGLQITKVEPPQRVYIPVSQHVGPPCEVKVEVGEEVKKGQVIADTESFVSAPIHASVSGTVVAIERRPHQAGNYSDCIVIENDFQDTWVETVGAVEDPDSIDKRDIVEKIHAMGVVGMGGGVFPTHIKYRTPADKELDYVILNGIECEPYITSDHRSMLEEPDKIVRGLRYMLKASGAKWGLIGIEDNKMDAVEVLKKACEPYPELSVIVCGEKYPQGSEKQLVYALTGREIPVGGLPMDVSVLVNNVGTAKAVCDAVEENRPLVERVVTLTGDALAKPANYLAPVGMLFGELIEVAGGSTVEEYRIISGGPMMGYPIYNGEFPLTKGTTAILVMKDEGKPRMPERNCVRCGKCIEVCPAFLQPTRLNRLARLGDYEALANEETIMTCIECGSCTYVCPAAIPLLEWIRHGKQGVIRDILN